MLFVKKYWNIRNKIQFYLLGFRGQPLWLMIKILRYAQWTTKIKLFKALWRGTFYWMYTKKKDS
jgi:hypothetical protein